MQTDAKPRFGVYLTPGLEQRIRAEAYKRNVSKNTVVLDALKAWFAREE